MLKKTKILIANILCLTVLLLSFNTVSAQPGTDPLPKVMLIGENEVAFEQMQIQYEQTLLGACGNNFDTAYNAWVDVLLSMEAYSDQISFDLKGVKMWLYVFFDKDGTIKHIAYYLRPNSRNISTPELTAFFNSYMNRYRIAVAGDRKFSHYGTVSFPMLPHQISEK